MLGALLDCFRPVAAFVTAPRQPELHTAALTAFVKSTCVLQHYVLQFLSEVRHSTAKQALGGLLSR